MNMVGARRRRFDPLPVLPGLVLLVAFLLGQTVLPDKPARAQEAPSFDQAMEIIAAEIKARQGGSTGPVIRPRTGGGGQGGQVRFKLEIDPSGRSRVTTLKNCFGVTLQCRAMILEPEGKYDVRVGTDAGSSHAFEKIISHKEVVFDLKTKGGLSRTEFFVELISLDPSPGGEAVVTMRYVY